MAADVSTKNDLPSAWLLRFSPYLKEGMSVLEIASGNGRNTRFMAGLGCKITAVDINAPSERIEKVSHILRDLEQDEWIFEPKSFDVVVGINYLWRDRFLNLVDCVKPGGLFLYETFTRHQSIIGFGPKNPQHFLQDGELLSLIPTKWHILAFEDGRTDNDRYIQRIAAIRPTKTEFLRLDICARR